MNIQSGFRSLPPTAITRWNTDTYICQVLNAASTVAMAANTLYAVPIFIENRGTATKIGVNVTTLVAATNVRLAIYRDNGNGQPGLLVVDGGTVTTSSTGNREVTISTVLDPGMYWLAMVGDGIPTLVMATLFSGWMGLNSALQPYHWTGRAFTFGAFPADESAQAYTPQAASSGPVLWVRA